MAKIGEAWLKSPERRVRDIALASSLSIPLVPLALTAAALVGAIEREQPFFSQERIGQGGETIRIRKIRSMPHGTEETMSNGHYDSRRTRMGKILSAIRLDEVSQLQNIFDGSMSVVGARPLVKVHHEQFMTSIATLDEDPELITDPYLNQLKNEGKSIFERLEWANEVIPAGWFDPHSVDVYVRGGEATYEARARSRIEYAETASYRQDLWIMRAATGVLWNLGHPEIVLPN